MTTSDIAPTEAAYWDPLPDISSSADAQIPGRPTVWNDRLPEPAHYLRGQWQERNWRNVPGPIYGAGTDTCEVGRLYAPDHIAYDESGQEFLYRQPRAREDVLHILFGAWADPFSGWAFDGDQHWTPELVRQWWRDRDRLREWIDQGLKDLADIRGGGVRDTNGLVEYAAYIGGPLKSHLRGYTFWLIEGRVPLTNETLPPL